MDAPPRAPRPPVVSSYRLPPRKPSIPRVRRFFSPRRRSSRRALRDARATRSEPSLPAPTRERKRGATSPRADRRAAPRARDVDVRARDAACELAHRVRRASEARARLGARRRRRRRQRRRPSGLEPWAHQVLFHEREPRRRRRDGARDGDRGRRPLPRDADAARSRERANLPRRGAARDRSLGLDVRLLRVFSGAFYTLVPIRPRSRGERRSLRTFPGVSLRPPLAFNPRPRRLSTPPDAFELHPDIRLYGTTLSLLRSRVRASRRRPTSSATTTPSSRRARRRRRRRARCSQPRPRPRRRRRCDRARPRCRGRRDRGRRAVAIARARESEPEESGTERTARGRAPRAAGSRRRSR